MALRAASPPLRGVFGLDFPIGAKGGVAGLADVVVSVAAGVAVVARGAGGDGAVADVAVAGEEERGVGFWVRERGEELGPQAEDGGDADDFVDADACAGVGL